MELDISGFSSIFSFVDFGIFSGDSSNVSCEVLLLRFWLDSLLDFCAKSCLKSSLKSCCKSFFKSFFKTSSFGFPHLPQYFFPYHFLHFYRLKIYPKY